MEKVEYYFREISKIPRGSYNEKAICDYVENFAKERNIKYVRDKMHNIVLFKEATKGYEDHGVTKNITIAGKNIVKPLKSCLKTASGFGGCNASILLVKK